MPQLTPSRVIVKLFTGKFHHDHFNSQILRSSWGMRTEIQKLIIFEKFGSKFNTLSPPTALSLDQN